MPEHSSQEDLEPSHTALAALILEPDRVCSQQKEHAACPLSHSLSLCILSSWWGPTPIWF